MDKARRAAVLALMQLHRGRYTADAADSVLSASSLSPRDGAFAAAVFFTAAEHLYTLDTLLRPFSRRPLEKLDLEVRAILETALAQILYMRVPARAAVNEAVSLAAVFKKGSAGGFINAVLRKAASAELPVDAFSSEEERICVLYSLSRPVAAALMKAMPDDYEAFLKASWYSEELGLRVNTLKTTREELSAALAEQGHKVRPGPLPNALWARISGGVAAEPLFESGLYHVQNGASQYACACVEARAGMRVLDLCAAPGGKSATLAEEMGGGQGLTVCDVNKARLAKAVDLFRRLGIVDAVFLENDAAGYEKSLEGQDAVLCDVPCSGLGVLATKPDLRYGGGENYENLPSLQLKILATAARYVKQGGRLVYSTCTVRQEENEQVVHAFLAKMPNFRLLEPYICPQNALVRDKMMTILPQNTGLAGFFVASMERL
ncbi:16S rRNA (cytosine(967)-C(5))-methyltransferase RsmB [Ruminococcaceae bacterium OttesenSCG-928-I18]|nr:16S rRNA (cytosine(967)-C(5))-methyltransferase RsmB [Ruminococcaceae bacterium OttesenSCG-928-I18]